MSTIIYTLIYKTVKPLFKILILASEGDTEDNKSYLIGIVVMASILIILLVTVLFVLLQNRKLKVEINNMKKIGKQEPATSNTINDQLKNVIDLGTHDDAATYTELNRTGNNEEDNHLYCHLNAIPEDEAEI